MNNGRSTSQQRLCPHFRRILLQSHKLQIFDFMIEKIGSNPFESLLGVCDEEPSDGLVNPALVT